MTGKVTPPDAVIETSTIDRTNAERFLHRLDRKAGSWTFQTLHDKHLYHIDVKRGIGWNANPWV